MRMTEKAYPNKRKESLYSTKAYTTKRNTPATIPVLEFARNTFKNTNKDRQK